MLILNENLCKILYINGSKCTVFIINLIYPNRTTMNQNDTYKQEWLYPWDTTSKSQTLQYHKQTLLCTLLQNIAKQT